MFHTLYSALSFTVCDANRARRFHLYTASSVLCAGVFFVCFFFSLSLSIFFQFGNIMCHYLSSFLFIFPFTLFEQHRMKAQTNNTELYLRSPIYFTRTLYFSFKLYQKAGNVLLCSKEGKEEVKGLEWGRGWGDTHKTTIFF